MARLDDFEVLAEALGLVAREVDEVDGVLEEDLGHLDAGVPVSHLSLAARVQAQLFDQNQMVSLPVQRGVSLRDF